MWKLSVGRPGNHSAGVRLLGAIPSTKHTGLARILVQMGAKHHCHTATLLHKIAFEWRVDFCH